MTSKCILQWSIKLPLQWVHIHNISIPQRHQTLRQFIVMQRMTCTISKINNSLLSTLLINHQQLLITTSHNRHANWFEVFYLANIKNRGSFLNSYRACYLLFLQIPEIKGCIVSSNPVIKKREVEYFIAPLLQWNVFLGCERITSLPKYQHATCQYSTYSVVFQAVWHWQYTHLFVHLSTLFRSHLVLLL